MGYHKSRTPRNNTSVRDRFDPIDVELRGNSLARLWELMRTALGAKDDIIADLRDSLEHARHQLAASEGERRELGERAFLLAAELDALRVERTAGTKPHRSVRSWLQRR